MSASHDPDRQFDENLHVLGSRIPVPAGTPEEVRSACVSALGSSSTPSQVRSRWSLRRPALLSTLGLAACLALVVGLLFPFNGGPTVQAATILAKLNEQIEGPQLVEIAMESVTIENVHLDGWLHVCDDGVAGDVQVVVTEGPDRPEVDLDVSMAVSPDQSWILIRKLELPGSEAAPVLALFFPPGSETLLLLPEEIAAEELDLDLSEELRELSSVRLVDAFQELIRNQPETGATITEQSDGTLLLSLPMADAEALEGLIRIGMATAEEHGDSDPNDPEAEIDIGDAGELFGSTIEIVYDPRSEQVRSFALRDLGATKGTISVTIRGGEMDPELLDSKRVTTPATRVFDLEGFRALAESLGSHLESTKAEDEM